MATWIALFRGINVGGKNILPMAQLKSDLEALQLKNIRTSIQSGNVVFDSAAKSAASLTAKISLAIEQQHGFRPQLLLIKPDELREAIVSNPFAEAISDPKTLHFFFLATPPSDPDIQSLENAKSASERYQIADNVFYLHAPDGIGRSKLATNAEKHLGVVATARNYRTVEKLASMVAGDGSMG
ncbi:hypothetical protein Poly24_30470 [Rosistilla carotiformis]|uniref:DUF1697 domain-containing protein n=1 Tax=Rosistilla carotiformis TaxID=2528017 RepID=A0A518JUW1_9BACT|nr:DUF1697 domain-containing protein [Rosistilla carotiformis]QDV69332.1 hypothetical protein Poly24_30470 [Rosistilla carotiformis]